MKRILVLALLLLSVIVVAEPVLAGPSGGSGGQWETKLLSVNFSLPETDV